jgi:hypothetical protein
VERWRWRESNGRVFGGVSNESRHKKYEAAPPKRYTSPSQASVDQRKKPRHALAGASRDARLDVGLVMPAAAPPLWWSEASDDAGELSPARFASYPPWPSAPAALARRTRGVLLGVAAAWAAAAPRAAAGLGMRLLVGGCAGGVE